MENSIYSIAILNLKSEIGFLIKQPEFDTEITSNFSKQITSFLQTKSKFNSNFTNSFLYVSMEYNFNSYIKAKISIAGKVCIIILYSPLIDLHYINLFNDSLKRSLYSMAGGKKLKLEQFKGFYFAVNKMIRGTLGYMNPYNIYITAKKEYKKDKSNIDVDPEIEKTLYGIYDIYLQRFYYAKENLKKTTMSLNLIKYSKLKQENKFRKNIDEVVNSIKFKSSQRLIRIFKRKRNNLLKYFDIEDDSLLDGTRDSNLSNRQSTKTIYQIYSS